MAGTTIPFFPRQTVVIPGTADSSYLSEPFDVSQYKTVAVSFRVFGLVGTSPSVGLTMETTDNLNADAWQPMTGTGNYDFSAISGSPDEERKWNSDPAGRFLRAKLDLTGTDVVATLHVLGAARED